MTSYENSIQKILHGISKITKCILNKSLRKKNILKDIFHEENILKEIVSTLQKKKYFNLRKYSNGAYRKQTGKNN